MQIIHLQGSDQIAVAAARFGSAVDQMSRALASLDETLARHAAAEEERHQRMQAMLSDLIATIDQVTTKARP